MYFVYVERNIGCESYKWEFVRLVRSEAEAEQIKADFAYNGINSMYISNFQSWDELASELLICSIQGNIYQIEISGDTIYAQGKYGKQDIRCMAPFNYVPYFGLKKVGEKDSKWVGC